jgi:hypothetical protein
MTNRFVRAIAASIMLTVGSGSVGCGYFLHPERRGTQSGVIDGATMVMDCLWLLAGIVPGVVALVVDFSSGGIYISGSRHAALRLTPDGHLALNVPRASRPGRVEFRLVTASHEVVARKTVMVGAAGADDSVELQLAQPAKGPIFLEVENANGRSARLPDAIETARL